MIHWSLVKTFILIFIISTVGTMFLEFIFRYLGVRGYLGNLFPNVRGGTPRGVGIILFLLFSFLLLPNFNILVLFVGIFAILSDIFGRTQTLIGIEMGQLSKLIGFVLVILIGLFSGIGPSIFLIALLLQPVSLSDMQPGSTCMITIILSVLTIIIMLIVGSPEYMELPAFYTPLLLLLSVLGYSLLDFSGRVMLGDVGNHAIAIALGASFYLVGGFWSLLVLFFVTICFTIFVRRNNLEEFLVRKLGIVNPTFGDFVMEVLTGGSVGDLIRKYVFGTEQKIIQNNFLIKLGFRRLCYNPYAPNHARYESNYKLGRLGD